MLSFTEQGRKTVHEIRIHFPGFHQYRSSESLWPSNVYTTHFLSLTHTLGGEMHTPPKLQSMGIFFTQGLTQRAGTSSAVLTLWSGCPLFWPSWLCLSTMGEAANCQLLCPHYPRPPAQTGALGHCPRNHSAPVASQES